VTDTDLISRVSEPTRSQEADRGGYQTTIPIYLPDPCLPGTR
jgi:hypothetical protein